MAQVVGGLEIRHRQRLAARHVHIGLYRHIRDPVPTDLVDEGLELGQIDVALERMLVRRVM